MRVLPRSVLLLLGLLAATVSGCATRPPASDPDLVNLAHQLDTIERQVAHS